MSTTWPLFPMPATEEVDFLGHSIRVHELAVPAFRVVALRAERTEYGLWLQRTESATPTGAFNYRNRRPYPESPVTLSWHSEHAHGVAADVNYDDNPFRTDGVLATDFDRFGYDDGVDWLTCWLEPPDHLPLFFRWGGGWTTDLHQAAVNLRHNGERIRTGSVDPMHFELALTPAECKTYDWRRAIEREEAMNKQIEQAVAFVEKLREELKPGREEATPSGAAQRVARAVRRVEGEQRASSGGA